jgi:arylformamidase
VEIFDLTHPLVKGMPVLDGDPPVAMTPALSHEVDGYAVTNISLGSHSGTHLDAPRHFHVGGKTLDEYPIDRFVRPGVVLDVRNAEGGVRHRAGPAEPAMIDDVLLAERLHASPARPGGFVLLWTEGALLTPAAALLLVDAGVVLVGTDGTSLDEEPYPVHGLLLGHDVLIAENLCGLDRLGPDPVTCAFLPLAVAEADGAPARAIAWR